LKVIALVCLLALSAPWSPATPIQPNLEKLLQESEKPPLDFPAARAGWNGPEMMRNSNALFNPELEALRSGPSPRTVLAALAAAATPDPRAVAGLVALIFLLRRARRNRGDARRCRHLCRDAPSQAGAGPPRSAGFCASWGGETAGRAAWRALAISDKRQPMSSDSE